MMRVPVLPRPEGVHSLRQTRAILLFLLLYSLLPRLWLAGTDLHSGRWWDERINLENVSTILGSGRLQPANFWYGSLSYLPQTLILAAWGEVSTLAGDEGFAIVDGREFTPLVYLVCRLLQVVYGVLTVAATFVIGRRLFSPEVGLIASCLLAASPRHVQASAVFKPDILLLLTSLLAFYWCAGVARKPSLGRYLLAGAGVGLATATKLNGATMAIPLLVVTAAGGWRDARRWLRLALGGVAALVVFLAFNPDLGEHLRHLSANRALYEDHASDGHLAVLSETLSYALTDAFHGPWIAILSLGGLLLVARAVADRGLTAGPGPLWIAFLSYPIAYFLIYAGLTGRAKPNHFLQILPFTSILAAFALAAIWDWAAHRLTWGRRRLIPVAFAVILGLWTVSSSLGYASRVVIPHTGDLAAKLLRQVLPEPLEGRWVYFETAAAPQELWSSGTARSVAGRLSDLPPEKLDLADAEVFPRRNLEVEGQDFYLRRIARVGSAGIKIVEGKWLEARGPDLVVVLHPLALAQGPQGEPLSLRSEDGGALSGRLPSADELLSLRLQVPRRRGALQSMSLEIGGRRLQWTPVGNRGEHKLVLSSRFRPAGPGEREISIVIDQRFATPEQIEVCLYRWTTL